MKRSDLSRAQDLNMRLNDIQQAGSRCQEGSFKQALLVVQGAGHGAMGMDQRPLNEESRILLSREEIEEILGYLNMETKKSLTALGIDD